MKRSNSLPVRLAATSLVVATLTAAALVAGLQVLLAHTNSVALHSRLSDRAASAAARVQQTGDGIRIAGSTPTLLEQDAWIFDGRGRLRSGRLSTSQDELGEEVRALARTSSAVRVDHGDLVLLAEPVLRAGRQVATVVVAGDQQPYENSERHSLWLSLVLAAASVVIATVAAWMAASRSLRRVKAMADAADDWREHDLGTRFDPGPGGDEIAHLARTLDTMLDRISEALSAERRLTDEIAHELRTPLAVVLGEAELARSGAVGDARESLDAIHDAAMRMSSAIDTMLEVARASTDARRVSRLGDLVEALDQPPTALDDILLAAPTAPLVAAVRPLLENAERHGAGPVRLEVVRDGHSLVLGVVDDGPGVPPDDLEAVFEPGHSTGADGAGLGLPLARRMASSVGAALTARPGPGGRFELRIPLH
jgi:signal transduction histidine kinase